MARSSRRACSSRARTRAAPSPAPPFHDRAAEALILLKRELEHGGFAVPQHRQKPGGAGDNGFAIGDQGAISRYANRTSGEHIAAFRQPQPAQFFGPEALFSQYRDSARRSNHEQRSP